MKDSAKACEHTLSDDVVFKEVVVIGNGPSGMVTSFMLAGNVPYLKEIPEDLPIDEMLRARLSNLPPGQSLYETDLLALAEGLEGRSQNPIPLLMDNLMRPCADMGIQADSLIEWKFDIDKQIEHVVLGRGPPGGAWHTFPPAVRTLSPGAWLSLPPHAAAGAGRLSARSVAKYCRRYVHECRLQRYFRSGVVVNSVTLLPHPTGPPCNRSCPHNARFCVSGYDKCEGVGFRYACARVVVACGAAERPNALAHVAPHALHTLAAVERALAHLHDHAAEGAGGAEVAVAVVGSGASAADAVRLARRRGLRARHVHRAPAPALQRLAPAAYPDYCQVYKMMCDGPSGNHPNYTSYPYHVIVDVTPLPDPSALNDPTLRLKRITLLNTRTNQTTQFTVSLIAVLIGSKPDLFFLQTNFDLNCIDICHKCTEETKHAAKRKLEDENQRQCFLKNHWHYLKSVLGQSIQSCKSRYLNYTEINGNTDVKCVVPECKEKNYLNKLENCISEKDDCKCEIIPYTEPLEHKAVCTCQSNPYSSGIGYGVDPTKPVDGRENPIAIDKSTHELLNAPKGIYALGPLTADNFVRFIPGGALAIVASMHKEFKE